jgi:ribosomal protein S12 methylthiotransferase accessory factor
MTIESQTRPALLEVDLTSEQGLALQRAVSDRYGPNIVRAAHLASRMFLLRSPWAPGLRFIGAETRPWPPQGDGAAPVSFSLSGSGETLEQAFVSCVGEGVDRLAQIERQGDIATVASLPEVESQLPPDAAVAIARDMAEQSLAPSTPLAWVRGRRLDGEHAFAGGRDVLLPADWCLRRAGGEPRLRPRSALSVGVATGPSLDWAASRALLELIERDAASLWWTGGRRGKAVPLDHTAMAPIVRLAGALRQQAHDRSTWLLDITTDIAIPVVAALSCNRDGRQLAYGFAARRSIADAAQAAILELCQTELAIQFALIKQAELGEERLQPADRAHLERDRMIRADQCELLHPRGVRLGYDAPAGGELQPLAIANALAACGIEVSLMEMTRPEFDIPVVRAVAPALQPMPSAVVTDRLRRALGDFGGGERFTGGLALIE